MVIEWTESLVGFVLAIYGACFFVLGMALISRKPDLKSAGVFFVLAGAVGGIGGVVAMTLGMFIAATQALIFAVAWVAAGIILIQGYGLVSISDYAVYSAIAMIWYVYAFALLATDYVLAWSTGWWILAFGSLAAMCRGKLSREVTGWIFLAQAFYTLLIPAWLYFMGIAPIA